MRPAARIAFGSLVGVVLRCGGARETFAGNVYRSESIAFVVSYVGESWRRIDVPHANLAYRDGANRASIVVDGRCNVRDEDAPLVSLADQLLMGTTEREFLKEEVVPFDGREARHAVLTAKLDGVRMEYDLYVMKKDGCVYDLVYVGAPDKFDEGAPHFERFARGFRATSVKGPS